MSVRNSKGQFIPKELCIRGHKLLKTRPDCLVCRSDSQRKWRNSHPEQARQYLRNSRYKRLYGITSAEFNNLLDQQDGLCAICRLPIPRFDHGNRYPAVDHDHITGKVRGITHGRCNRGIGMFDDDPQKLRQAADYLENFICKK